MIEYIRTTLQMDVSVKTKIFLFGVAVRRPVFRRFKKFAFIWGTKYCRRFHRPVFYGFASVKRGMLIYPMSCWCGNGWSEVREFDNPIDPPFKVGKAAAKE